VKYVEMKRWKSNPSKNPTARKQGESLSARGRWRKREEEQEEREEE